MKKLTVILACAMTVGLLAGCGNSFDASAYTQALLDNSYKNDSSLLVSQKIGTAEEAEEIYEQGVDLQVDSFFIGTSPTGEQKEKCRDVLEDILASAKYTVGEAEKQSDGSYVVSVTYEKMNVFGPMMDDFLVQSDKQTDIWAESGEYPSTDEIMEWSLDTMIDCLADAAANATYEAPEETTIRIEIVNRTYTPNSSDIQNLTTLLFDNYQ